ncbi:MAG: MBL fold metallo-hydrolase [Candidatus Micrarchaeaceae archaeon]
MGDERKIMLDFGIKVDHKTEFPISVPQIDAAVISHAHLDHSGFAPALYNDNSCPVFGTKPTLELSLLLIEDAMKIAKNEHSNIHYHKRQTAVYKNKFVTLNFGQKINFGNYEISLYDAGHICGSAITLIDRKHGRDNKRVVYTGDFKLSSQFLHNGAEVVKSDILIIESTYESREHTDRKELESRFIEDIKAVLDDGGTVLIPVFAVGRSQEILGILYKHRLTPVSYMDGMARAATTIVAKNSKFIKNGDILSKAVMETIWVDDYHIRKEALKEPSIILTTAGMLNGGPALNYITKLNKSSKIFLTGYQAEGTNGRQILEDNSITIDNKKIRINNEVKQYDFSAHASDSELYEYVRRSAPNHVICVHGDRSSTMHFAESLKGEGFDAYAPAVGERIELPG